MSRIAIIGSCITRDLWPILGETPKDLLYISRTSLASLFAPSPAGMDRLPEAVGLKPNPRAALARDLDKSALAALVAHRPTHIIFDFIDERFDLLSVGGGRVTDSWELNVSGYLDEAAFQAARQIPRLSPECDRLWTEGALEMAAFLAATPLRDATVLLHEAQWATRHVAIDGGVHDFAPQIEVIEGRETSLVDQNALLERYQARFVAMFPGAVRMRADAGLCVGDEGHRWGLSPFHYVADYYRDVWGQLRAVGAV